jgi:hypothetical protein
MSSSTSTLDTIKGMLNELSEKELSSLVAEIAYSHNIGIPVWFSASKVIELAEENFDTVLTTEEAHVIIERINDTEDHVSLNDIADTHIEMYIQDLQE